MARYAKVDVRIWDDEKVRAMSPIPPCGQGLWIRLLVSRHRSSIPGLLCVGEAALSEEFGWSLKAFREAFSEALAKGLVKADWNARLVWLPNACKYNPPESPNVVKSWRIPWDEAPECVLKSEAFRGLKAFIEGLGEGFRKAFEQALAKGMPNQDPDPEPEQEQEQESEIENACAETPMASSAPPEPPVLVFPCDGHVDHWDLMQSQVDEWQKLFPSQDVIGESRKALAWVQAQPSKRKTAKGMPKFLVGWLGRNQDGGRVQQGAVFNRATSRDVRTGHTRAEDFKHDQVGEIKL